jgi:hypothetical protein
VYLKGFEILYFRVFTYPLRDEGGWVHMAFEFHAGLMNLQLPVRVSKLVLKELPASLREVECDVESIRHMNDDLLAIRPSAHLSIAVTIYI